SPLAQGLLTAKYIDGDVPADSRAANSHFLNGSALTDSYLERIRGMVDRLARLTSQLRTFAYKSELPLAPVLLSHAIADAQVIVAEA
ncbi:hypothetical protein HER21_46770, partial [Pseudomonas sp. BGM005]|nr:hypothetical protein [Pseudomonas sp. BG5]